MLNMGVAPFNVASSVIMITAQRLGRKLCPQCKKPEDIPPEALIRAGFREEDIDGTWQPYGPVGCDHCRGTGYKGRVGIYQVLPISDDMRQLIMRRAGAGRRRARPAPVRPAEGARRHHLPRGNRGGDQRMRG
jgi:type IV pilus assembly protein PilB